MATTQLPTKNAWLIITLPAVTVLGRLLNNSGKATAGTKIQLGNAKSSLII
jgi:hypothetical protein